MKSLEKKDLVISSLKKVENAIFDHLFLHDNRDILPWARSQIQMIKMLEIESQEEKDLKEYLTYYIELSTHSTKSNSFSTKFSELIKFAAKIRDGTSDYVLIENYEAFLDKPGTKYPFVLTYRKNLSLIQLIESLKDGLFDYKIYCLQKTLKVAPSGPERIVNLRAAWYHIQILPNNPFSDYGYNPLLEFLGIPDVLGVSQNYIMKPFLDKTSPCTVLDFFRATPNLGNQDFIERAYTKLEPLFTDFYPLIHNPKATILDYCSLCERTRHLLDMDLTKFSSLLCQLNSDDALASVYWNLLVNKDFVSPSYDNAIADDFSQNSLDLLWSYLFEDECPYMTSDLFYRSRLSPLSESLFTFNTIGLSCDYRWMCLPEYHCTMFDEKYRPAFKNGISLGINASMIHPCGVDQGVMIKGNDLVSWLLVDMGDHLGSSLWSRNLKPSLDPILEDVITITDRHLNFNDDVNFRVSFNESRTSFGIVSGYPYHKRLISCVKD